VDDRADGDRRVLDRGEVDLREGLSIGTATSNCEPSQAVILNFDFLRFSGL
jgi:hypothetical protein